MQEYVPAGMKSFALGKYLAWQFVYDTDECSVSFQYSYFSKNWISE